MRELLDLLIRSHIPLLIIGGHAVGTHGFQRDTGDVDCLLVAERREEMKAFLESHGFEETARHEGFSRYRHKSLAYPMLDVMQVNARTWEQMSSESVEKDLKGLLVRVPAVIHLIALKLHAIRQDPTGEFQDGNGVVELLRVHSELVSTDKLRLLFERYQLMPLFAKVKSLL